MYLHILLSEFSRNLLIFGRRICINFCAVTKLMDAAKGSRNAARDRCLLLLMFRHGLRVSEACGLQLSQVDTDSRVLHVARLKQGLSTAHPLRGDEIRVIKGWLVERARMKLETSAFFVRGYPETFSHCYSEITQPPCGNETQGDRRERVCSA
jgi:type 1 fimbriae regulatory protein FimB